MTFQETMAKIAADTKRIRDARLEFEAAMQVYNPDINAPTATVTAMPPEMDIVDWSRP